MKAFFHITILVGGLWPLFSGQAAELDFSDHRRCYELMADLLKDENDARAMLDPKVTFGNTNDSFEDYRENLRRIARSRAGIAPIDPSTNKPDTGYLLRTSHTIPYELPVDFEDHKVIHVTRYESHEYLTTLYRPKYRHGVHYDVAQDAGIRWDESGNRNFHELIRTDAEKRKTAETLSHSMQVAGQKRYGEMVASWMEFYLANIVGRRSWPVSFQDELKQIAQAEAGRSTWIVVEKKGANGQPAEIVSTMRIIDSEYGHFDIQRKDKRVQRYTRLGGAPYGHFLRNVFKRNGHSIEPPLPLPVEIESGLTLPRPIKVTLDQPDVEEPFRFGIGRILEPGSWAIKQTDNKPGIGRAFLHLAMLAFYEGVQQYGPENQMIYTYADAISRRLYSALGFVPLLGDDGKPVKFTRHGIDWTVMQLTQTRLIEMTRALNQVRRDWNESEAERVDQLLLEMAWHEGITMLGPPPETRPLKFLDIGLE